ncbi:MAG TPA: alpha/beta hydrolase fold domain-containing protein [Acidobacteriaceae bacterium]|nr:alpha/beta hydrolase fold domain-containing protein [Acidobacteriaceae bacterium]
MMKRVGVAVAVMACAGLVMAQQTATWTGPKADTSVIDAQGTAHVQRVVPVPEDLSPQARAWVGQRVNDAEKKESIAEQRRGTDAWQERAGAQAKLMYPVNVTLGKIAGVPVRIITPLHTPANKRDRVLINVHGGGFVVDSGSLTETIPIANLTQTKVIAVLYRLSPEHKFPAAVDDAVAVYKALLKTHQARNMAIYGTSAGAILTPEIAVRLQQLGLPLPAALGVFSGMGDFSRPGDSQAMYALNGLSGYLTVPDAGTQNKDYVGTTDPRDRVLSPLFADVKGFPPTMFMTSTRDLLLSGTSILQRHFYESGVTAPMVVFEGLPHAFWNNFDIPESREAFKVQAQFFDKYVGH